MQISEAFPSKYLSVTDLKGNNARVTISHVVEEKMGDGQSKPVVYFQKAKKGMVLNKTNAMSIAEAYGDDTDDWVGQEVVLFEVMTEFGGQPKPGIRCRKPLAKDAQARNAAPSRQPVNNMADDDIPL